MRLFGYSCRHAEPPLRSVFLPLQPLTVLLGANDSGKSSLLRAFDRDLSGGHYDGSESDRDVGGVFFAEASDEEFESLIRSAAATKRQLRDSKKLYAGERPNWGLRAWDPQNLPALPKESITVFEDWRHAVREHAPSTPGFDLVLEALWESRIVSLEPAGSENGTIVWNVNWCLPSFNELSAPIREGLRSSDLLPFAEGRDPKWFSVGTYTPFYGRPSHMWVKGAPVVVAPIGQTVDVRIPRGLRVPTEFGSLRKEVAASINGLVTAARHGRGDMMRDGEPLDAASEAQRTVPRNWMAQSESGWTPHPAAVGAVEFVASAANRILPHFLRERYRIVLVLEPLEKWVGRAGAAFDVRLHTLDADGPFADFSVERVADGLTLWVQMALLEACEQAARVETILYRVAADWWANEETAAHRAADGDYDTVERDTANAANDLFEGIINELVSLDPDTKRWVTGDLAEQLSAAESDDWTARRARPRRYFVVDEPERHLHPRLQREAAIWLRDTTSNRGAPCVVATHSPPFLGLPDDDGEVLFVHVQRNDDGVVCETFDAAEIRDLDEIVASLGFDRGELLTTVSQFMVVEGIHDAVFLNRVFDELRSAHIALVPMEGVSNYKAVVDSDALWRFTTAGVTLTTDKFDQELLRGVIADPEAAKALRTSDAEEETKLLGKLIGLAERYNKQIHLLGHRGADLIDVLDERVIEGVFPRFPGHVEAQRLWQERVAAGEKAGQRKVFYEQQFGIPANVDAYVKLADAHAAAGVKPPALQKIVNEAVSLASGQAAIEAIPTLPDRR